MRPLSEYLTVLAATADDIMRRPARELPETLPDSFIDLAAILRKIDASPAEGVRCTRSGVMMINAIEGFFEHGTHHWQMLIGATLPVLRLEAWRARLCEKEVAEAETKR